MAGQLDDIIGTVGLTDTELRNVLRNASEEAARIINSLEGNTKIGARVRSAQLQLAKAQVDMWAGVKDATTVGIGDAFDSSAQWAARFDYDLMRSVGMSSTHWMQSMLATSRAGLENYLARKENGYTLSQRVYRERALSTGQVDKVINNGLLLGKSAREIAEGVRKYISPNVPGGASYAAMRLGRTEVVNAYHANSRQRYIDSPWVERVRWNLSGSHPRPDLCNDYAESGDFPKDPGLYKPGNVPDKPHPQCLCYVTPEVPDLDTFAKNFKSGKYDNYVNNQMGCFHV